MDSSSTKPCNAVGKDVVKWLNPDVNHTCKQGITWSNHAAKKNRGGKITVRSYRNGEYDEIMCRYNDMCDCKFRFTPENEMDEKVMIAVQNLILKWLQPDFKKCTCTRAHVDENHYIDEIKAVISALSMWIKSKISENGADPTRCQGIYKILKNLEENMKRDETDNSKQEILVDIQNVRLLLLAF